MLKINYPNSFAQNLNKNRVGIDLSKNNTGVVLYNIQTNSYKYFLIVRKSQLKKNLSSYSKNITIITYEDYNDTNYTYSENEINKTLNFINLSNQINNIIKTNFDNYDISIRIEGVILDSKHNSAWSYDYSQLAGIVKSDLLKYINKDNILILSPFEVKKKFTGIATTNIDSKHYVKSLFLYINKDFENKGKIDDICDAFALSYEYNDKEHFENIIQNFLTVYINIKKVKDKEKYIDKDDFMINYLHK